MTVTLDRNNLPVLLLYNIDLTWPAEDITESLHEADQLGQALAGLGHPVTPVEIHDPDLFAVMREHSPKDHIIFNWCEALPGKPRSCADVAEVLDSLNFVYTGSSGNVLALSEDKPCVKGLLDARHVPTPRWRIYDTSKRNGWHYYPAIVKPAYEHCSFGVTSEAVVSNAAELRHRIEFVLDEFHQPALVEDFIDGREFHVSLWGNGTIEMLPVAEMDFSEFGDLHDRLCTFDAKFNPESTHYQHIGLRLPAPLTADELSSLEKVAVAAYRTLGCRDYARLDIRLRDGVFYVLDINPNPDLSSEASFACAADASGYTYGAMGGHLINLAALRSEYFGIPVPEKPRARRRKLQPAEAV